MENTKIEWADHTFNPWIGCTRVSPACGQGGKGGCYAEATATRFKLVDWGPTATRRRTSDDNWRKPLSWNRKAQAAGLRPKVFCASMADVFDDHESIQPEWRFQLWKLIAETPHLDWLLLTKRPENWPLLLPVSEPNAMFPHVRLGVTIEDQPRFDERGPVLQFAADLGWPTFVSYEPALGLVDWRPAFEGKAIGWLISGGESGPRSRPSHPAWFRAARDICAEFGIPYLHKQWGEWLPWAQFDGADIADDPEQTRFKTMEWENGRWNDVGYPMWCDSVDGNIDDEHCTAMVGKKAAGRLLDGVEHNGMPS